MSDVYFDKVTGGFVPASRLDRLHPVASRFFGYRDPDASTSKISPLEDYFWTLVATFAGLVTTMPVFKYGTLFINKGVPVIEPNWGASAILIYNVIGVPLAQPRNVLFGTLISSIIGVGLAKLWMIHPSNSEYLWLAGALATSISSVVMSVFNIVHPPAGAAALIPCVVAEAIDLGWYYLAVQALSSVIMLGVALVVNNIRRVYPKYWWLPK